MVPHSHLRPLHRAHCTGGPMRGGGGHYAGATVQVAESSWGMATMHTQFGWGPGAGCEAPIRNCAVSPGGLHPPPTVQLGMVRAGYPMVGRSFGHDLAGACIVRRSLYHTHWVCAVCCAQWAVPTDQLAQFGTKRAKRGRGFRGLRPQLWAPTISPVLGGSITSPPVGGSITS